MQPEIVPVRVDYGRLILEWVIGALVAFAVGVAILFTRAGVRPGVPLDFSAWAKSQGLSPVRPVPKGLASNGTEKRSFSKSFDVEAALDETARQIEVQKHKPFDPEAVAALDTWQTELVDYKQYLLSPHPPDKSGMHRYLLACFLLGVAALVFAALYPPWLGAAQEDLAKPSAERLRLVPAGYSWLWRPHRTGNKQAKT